MKTSIISFILSLVCGIAYAEPHCQGFNNYDNEVTIVFTDDKAGSRYEVTDVKLVTYGKEYSTTSVTVSVKDGTATVTLTFPHITQFSNPKVTLRINGRKKRFKVCQ
ncbi:hypothetical protein [uncultured Bacteroides sp.]|uniref:hypothetical protein n=1 Tax=uncultured Bacteroides sp. TaxID=162156 RepID=UPI002599BAED|nr:hypothetical protein [uncultured Bacteroides sp.]